VHLHSLKSRVKKRWTRDLPVGLTGDLLGHWGNNNRTR
jgi:hypothetical protein